ncbi:MAG: phosphoethanolamine transferase [Muribaculaceae bacterium]|nr:phosphoethanolamine transferase [Muribaculaceae bacterium]
MEKRRFGKTGWFPFSAILALLYSFLFVAAEFYGNPVAGLRGFFVIALQWGAVTLCCWGVIGALSVSRVVFAVVFPILMLLSATLAYFETTMGVEFTPASLELMLINDFGTWSTVMSPLLFIVMAAALLAGIGAAFFRWRHVMVAHPVDYLAISLVVAVTPFFFVKSLMAPVGTRMPYVFYCTVDQYLDNRININENRTTFDNVEVSVADSVPLDVVFVIGESLRADHLSLNGYSRPTTPLLEKDSNVISFPHMRTIPCFTHLSVPYILTLADSVNSARAFDDQSFITLFKKAGFSTAWISSQDETPAYAYFMHECDTIIMTHASKSLYDFGKWLDSDILPEFTAHGFKGERNLTVLHTIGSHWWYPSHYDEEDAVFKPETGSRILSELSREEIVNSYDNTIVATDRFLSAVIRQLRDRNAILIYISDHGEALGEDGNYLHGADYPELHNPACLVWYSDAYGQRYPERIEALRRNSSRRWLSDSMFHTVLDAASLSTPVKVDSLSLFR